MKIPVTEIQIAPTNDNRTARYRAVSQAAVVSVIAGGLSILLPLSWYFLPLPLAGIYLGWRSLRRIQRTPEELTGTNFARTGLGLSLAFLILGGGWLMIVREREVPLGYQRVDYAALQPDPTVADQVVPPGAMDFDGKKVFIKGYMVPGRQQVRLHKFLLCPTNGVCTFHFPNPKPTEVIVVTLGSDLSADYTTQLVGLGGKFHVDPDDPQRKPYSMDADYLRE